jgi:hypothetical protein
VINLVSLAMIAISPETRGIDLDRVTDQAPAATPLNLSTATIVEQP